MYHGNEFDIDSIRVQFRKEIHSFFKENSWCEECSGRKRREIEDTALTQVRNAEVLNYDSE